MRDSSRRQYHVNLAIAYDVWRYWEITTDIGFLSEFGVEMLCENARFWASLAQYYAVDDRYDIRGVMGPDEFHDGYPGRAGEGIDNNSYVNVMAAWSLARALDAVAILGGKETNGLGKWKNVSDGEYDKWDHMSRRPRLIFLDNGILGQFERFQELAEFDWGDYRSRYGDIGRLDLILEAEGDSCNNYQVSKQADVLMLLYLFSADELTSLIARLGYPFDPGVIPDTVDYYLQRTSNGSTLSRVAHAWVLIRGNRPESWEMLVKAVSPDLSDVQGCATREGIHLGAMAGSVDILHRCYTGLEFRDNMMWLHPQLPHELGGLTFDIQYRGHWLQIACDHKKTSVLSSPGAGAPISISIDGTTYEIASGEAVTHRGQTLR